MDEERSLAEKLSGRVRHPEDAGRKRILNAALLRSPIQSGRIAALELPPLPEGVHALVAKDIPGTSRISIGGETIPVLSGRDILWKGQPILAAAGPDTEELADWMSRITMDVREDDEKETVEDQRIFTKGDPSEGFSAAFQVIEENLEIPESPAAGIARSVTCLKDGSNYVLHAATPWPGGVRRNVSRILKVSRESIRVRPYPSTATYRFDLWKTVIEAGQAALLSWSSRKSVKFSVSPEEAGRWDPAIPAADFHLKGGIDTEGRILAIEGEVCIRSGASIPMENEFVDRLVLGIFSAYPCKNYSISVKILRHCTTPSALGPAAGFELGFIAGELLATRAAEHSLIAPGVWRLDALPVPGQPLGPGLAMPKDFSLPEVLAKAAVISDFQRKHASYEQARLGRENLPIPPEDFRGIGLACGWFGNGFLGAPKELGSASVSVTLEKDGILTIDIPVHTADGSLLRGWAIMAADILGLDSKAVRFVSELPSGPSDAGPSILGRNVSVYTKLIDLACNDLSKRRFRDALPITSSRSRRRSARKPWNPESLEGGAFEAMSWGAAVVEVTYCTRTGRIIPAKIWLVIDGGTIIMPKYALASVESASENALNSCVPDRSYGDTILMDIRFMPDPPRKGSKDVSTLPWITLPSAFIQAARQASGSDIHTLPVSPDMLKTEGRCR